MAGEGKYGTNAESIYVDTPEGIMTLLDYLGHNAGGDVDWDSLDGKPSVFPPEDHEHALGDVDGLTSALEDKVDTDGLESALADKVDSDDLADALAGKADTGDLDSKADSSTVSDLQDALDALTARVDALEPDPDE